VINNSYLILAQTTVTTEIDVKVLMTLQLLQSATHSMVDHPSAMMVGRLHSILSIAQAAHLSTLSHCAPRYMLFRRLRSTCDLLMMPKEVGVFPDRIFFLTFIE